MMITKVADEVEHIRPEFRERFAPTEAQGLLAAGVRAILAGERLRPRSPQGALRPSDARPAVLGVHTHVSHPSLTNGLSDYLKMARRHWRRNHRSMHASCSSPR